MSKNNYKIIIEINKKVSIVIIREVKHDVTLQHTANSKDYLCFSILSL